MFKSQSNVDDQLNLSDEDVMFLEGSLNSLKVKQTNEFREDYTSSQALNTSSTQALNTVHEEEIVRDGPRSSFVRPQKP